jgi:hypothetical protein
MINPLDNWECSNCGEELICIDGPNHLCQECVDEESRDEGV